MAAVRRMGRMSPVAPPAVTRLFLPALFSAGSLPVVFSVRFCVVRGARVPIYLCNNGEMCTALQHSSTPAAHAPHGCSGVRTASHPARAQTSETAQRAQPAQTRETQQRTRPKQGQNKGKTRTTTIEHMQNAIYVD